MFEYVLCDFVGWFDVEGYIQYGVECIEVDDCIVEVVVVLSECVCFICGGQDCQCLDCVCEGVDCVV